MRLIGAGLPRTATTTQMFALERLEVDVPAEELPRLNDTQSFREGIIGGALDVVNEWWQARERPTSGLHGAAVR
jgi:hypothetical protein